MIRSDALRRRERRQALLTVVFTIISVLYLMPVFLVLINSLKANAFVNTETFKLPTAESFVGLKNYVKGMTFGNFAFYKVVFYSFFITITSTALCGLGQSACKPVQSTLKYFRSEYLAHVVDHHCPICNREKPHPTIDALKCKGCGKCRKNCPMEAIQGAVKQAHTIDSEKCINCGACVSNCPFGAIAAAKEG